MEELRRGPELLEPGRDEARDMAVYPLGDLERQEVAHAGRDPNVGRGIRGTEDRRVARGDHAVLASPQHERRDLAQRRDLLAEGVAELLATGCRQEQEPAPARGLVRPADRADRK